MADVWGYVALAVLIIGGLWLFVSMASAKARLERDKAEADAASAQEHAKWLADRPKPESGDSVDFSSWP